MKHCKPGIRVALLLTGNEILSGDIVDTNSTFIAREFLPKGIQVQRKVVVGDDMEMIIGAIKLLAESSDIVIMNGGLGSTVDDLTAEAVSIVTGRPLLENPVAVEHIKTRYGRSFPDKNASYFKHLRKQALLPEGVEIVPNPVGLAVGFKVKINNAVFYCTPGVPREMKTMIKESILPDIIKQFPEIPTFINHKFKIIGTGESRIQQLIHQHIPEETWERIELGFRASMAIVEVKLAIRSQEDAALLASTEEQIKSIFNHQIAGYGETLQENVVRMLISENSSLCLVEQSSAGKIVQMINEIPEAENLNVSGYVFNQINMAEPTIGVISEVGNSDEQALVNYTEDLAQRYLKKTGLSHVLVSSQPEVKSLESTRIPEKRVVITCGSEKKLISREFVITREPEDFRVFVSIAALDLLRRYLLGFPYDNPYYFDELTRHLLK